MDETTGRQHLGSVRKNESQEIRVSVGDYDGTPYVYCLVCLAKEPPENEMERHPGLTVRAHTLRPLIPLLSKALEVAEAREKVNWDQGTAPRSRRRSDGR
jgi:hypothetical protein